jgi:hypothetical protein
MDRQSSDELAALGSDMMRADSGLGNDAVQAMIDGVRSGLAVHATEDEMRDALRNQLEPYLSNVRRLAASVVSQADGEE